MTANHKTPFYDFVRQRLSCFAEPGVLEVMHILIGSDAGPLAMANVVRRAGHRAAEQACQTLLAEGYIEQSQEGLQATHHGRALLPVLGPVFQWAHPQYRGAS
ncbi:MAG: hypothetical protein AAGA54_30490 [Myxococcota bacterium]